MKHEFYLNNELLDVDDSMAFQLIYQSPAFGDLSKLTTHYSTSLKFPLTANNRRIINNIDLQDIVTAFPYKKHVMDYYRNGVNIVLDGECIVLGVEETHVELQLIWGNKELLAPLKDKKLKDLPLMYAEWTLDGVSDMHNHGLKNYGFLFMDWGGGATNPEHHLPSVRVGHIAREINKIVKLVELPMSDLDLLYIPTIDRSSEGADWSLNDLKFIIKTSNFYYQTTEWGVSNFAVLEKIEDQWEEIEDGAYPDMITVKGDGVITLEGNPSYWIVQSHIPHINKLHGKIKIHKNNMSDDKIWEFDSYIEAGQFLKFDIFLEDDVKEGDVYIFRMMMYYEDDAEPPHTTPFYSQIINGTIYCRRIYDAMLFPFHGYPININLPDITYLNFLQMLMWIYGLFPYYDYDKPDEISFFKIDDIISNGDNGNYYDWTGKRLNKNIKHSYTYGDYARNNILDYKKDDTVEIDASGVIKVSNQNIDTEKKLVEMPVSATDSVGEEYMAIIPAFTIEISNEKEKITFKKTSPRIVQGTTNINNRWFGTFKPDMCFGGEDGIIAKRYEKYQDVIKTPRVITAEYLLSEIDLINFDMRKPIWDYTLGRMYAVIKLTLQTNGVAKIEMIDVSLIPME